MPSLEVSVPNVEYHTVSEAKQTMSALGLEVNVVGDGDTVLRQSPTGVSIERGGTIVFYTDNTTPKKRYLYRT